MLSRTRTRCALLTLPLSLGTTLAYSQPKGPTPPKPQPARASAYVPSVLCLPLPKLILPAGSRPDAWAKGANATADDQEQADLLDLDGDGTRDRFQRGACDGRDNCTVTMFVRRGDCGHYVGGFLGSANDLKLLPRRTHGLADLGAASCHNRGCDERLLRHDGYGYLEADSQRPQPPPLRVFPGVGIEQVAIGMTEAELLRLGWVAVDAGRLRQGPLEATLSASKTVDSIAYTEQAGASRRLIDLITSDGGLVRTGEMSTARIEELAEQIGRCGPPDPTAAGGRTIHCSGGTLLRATAQGRTIYISPKVPEPTARCGFYPGLGQGNSLEFSLDPSRSACLDGLHLAHNTSLNSLLARGCTSGNQSPQGGTGVLEATCRGATLRFSPDGGTLRSIVPAKRR